MDRNTWNRLGRLEATSGPGLRRELVELFLDTVERHRARLRGPLDADGGEDLARIAHTIKGSAGNLGGSRAQLAAAALEKAARQGGPPEALAGLTEDLLHELDILEQGLRERIGSPVG